MIDRITYKISAGDCFSGNVSKLLKSRNSDYMQRNAVSIEPCLLASSDA